jgi:hypothetical protein
VLLDYDDVAPYVWFCTDDDASRSPRLRPEAIGLQEAGQSDPRTARWGWTIPANWPMMASALKVRWQGRW